LSGFDDLPAQPELVERRSSPVDHDAVPAVREAILSALVEHPEGLDYRDLAAAIGREHIDATFHVAKNALLREGRTRLVDARRVKRRGRMVWTGSQVPGSGVGVRRSGRR
jgi:DNA-binding transcriptional ArsR family regulator